MSMEKSLDNPRTCHASCCNGKVIVTGPWGRYKAQALLDSESPDSKFKYGFFGKDHDKLLDVFVECRVRGVMERAGVDREAAFEILADELRCHRA